MSDWISFDQWRDCSRMERPGFIFEVANAEGQRMLTRCTQPFQQPWDWKSAPVQFRIIAEPKPRHSSPFPKPRGER